MKSILACCLFMCIAFSTVQSASYYYRAGREIIVPVVDETVKQVFVSDLKKDGLTVVDEAVILPVAEPASPIILAEEIVPVQNLRLSEPLVDQPEVNSVVAEEIKSAEIIDEARATPALGQEKLETLEIAQPVDTGLKTATIAETVKNAAIEALRSTNAETIVAEPVAVKTVPLEPVASQSNGENTVVPVAAPVAIIKTEEVLPELKSEAFAEEKSSDASKPIVRQQPSIIQQAQETITNLLNNNPIANAFNSIRNPTTAVPIIVSADPIGTPNVALESAASPAIPSVPAAAVPATPASPAPPAGPAALFQSIQNTLSNLSNALRPSDQRTSTVAPAVPAAGSNPAREDEEAVPIVQQTIDIVDDKVDVAKSIN